MRKIELINLTLDEIRRSATMVSDVYKDAAYSNHKEQNESFETLMSDCDRVLADARIKLRDVLENIAEFQNAKDMVCPVDMALSETSYNLIYERKDEYDFEEDQV